MGQNLGEFEQLILLALVRRGDNAYGITIRDEIVTHAGREPTLATVYKALWRLERKRLVTSRLGEPTNQRGGRRKRLYRVTAVGCEALQQSLEALRRLSRGVDKALELK